jgi:CDP-diacylglycerol--serine O-phosphatidyltransferase
VHLSPRSLTVFGFLTVAGVAVGMATRASFVLVIYTAAYIALGIAEAILARARPAPDRASLPPALRAELDADEALEPEPEDVEGEKPVEDEYI